MSQDGKKKVWTILDDLWNIVDLKDIELASPFSKGFKLFLTSRDERLCGQMGVKTSSSSRVDVLEEPGAKQYFWETTGLSDGALDHQDFLNIEVCFAYNLSKVFVLVICCKLGL